MTDTYKRRAVGPNEHQCGCRWERDVRFGSVLRECQLHARATSASVSKFERGGIQ